MPKRTNVIARVSPLTLTDPFAGNVSCLFLPIATDGAGLGTIQAWVDHGPYRLSAPVAAADGSAGDHTVGTRTTRGRAYNFTGSRLLLPNDAIFKVGSGDFTIEVGVTIIGVTAPDRFYITGKCGTGGATAEYGIYKTVGGTLQGFLLANSVSYNTPTTITPSTAADTKYDIILYRRGTKLGIAINGVNYGETAIALASDSAPDNTTRLAIGGFGEYFINQSGSTHRGAFGVTFPGWVHYYRFTKGVSRWGNDPVHLMSNQFRGMINTRQL